MKKFNLSLILIIPLLVGGCSADLDTNPAEQAVNSQADNSAQQDNVQNPEAAAPADGMVQRAEPVPETPVEGISSAQETQPAEVIDDNIAEPEEVMANKETDEDLPVTEDYVAGIPEGQQQKEEPNEDEVMPKKQSQPFVDPWLEEDDDNDGLTNGDEVNIYKTNPFNADSDLDSYSDKQEIDSGHDPLHSAKGGRIEIVEEGSWFLFHNISVTELPGWELAKFDYPGNAWWRYYDPKNKDGIMLRKDLDEFTEKFKSAPDKIKFLQDQHPENANLEVDIVHNMKGLLFYRLNYDTESDKTGIPYYLLTKDGELYNFSAYSDVDGDPNQGEGIYFDLNYYTRQFFNSINVVEDESSESGTSNQVEGDFDVRVIAESTEGHFDTEYYYNLLELDKPIEISEYSAPIYMLDGEGASDHPYIGPELIRLKGKNERTITVDGNEITIRLEEVHILNNGVHKSVCAKDTPEICEDINQWFIFKINGYRTELTREEIKEFTFDNSLVLALVAADDDIELLYGVK